MEGGGEGGSGGVHHRNEDAISAEADGVGFLDVEEEEEDYEDLYNDVNVGEGFLQSLNNNKTNEPLHREKEVKEDDKLGFRQDVNVNSTADNFNNGNGNNSIRFEEVAERKIGLSGRPGPGGEGSGGRVSGYEGGGFRGMGGGASGGLRVELGQSLNRVNEEEKVGSSVTNNSNNVSNTNVGGLSGGVQGSAGQQLHGGGGGSSVSVVGGNVGNENMVGQNVNGGGSMVGNFGGVGGGGGGGTILFVGDLHWWTTDADLESELCKYGAVKEVKFFDEKASGKSKGYCQVEFYDPAAAAACKEGMNGHVFNGRPCVVAFASPYSVKRMGEAQVNRNQQMAQSAVGQARRGNNDGAGKTGSASGPGSAGPGNNIATSGNYQGGEGNNRGYGRGNWGRGNAQGMGGRGPIGPMRNRAAGGMGGRGIMGNAGNGFGQGIGATPPLLHPNPMMCQGFDPAFGGPMGRMGTYGGFPGAPAPPFSGLMSSFPPVGGMGLPGVAPHVNPAFFGRGMPMNGMGMMPTNGMDGPSMGMWSDPGMGGWGGEEHGGGRAGESSYGEEAASDHQYAEVSHDRGGYPVKDKDKASERDWSGSSDRRYRDNREIGSDRDMPREKDDDQDWPERRHRDDRDDGRERERGRERDRERSRDRDRDRDRDRYRDDRDRNADHHRYRDRDREVEHDEEWDRGRSSKSHSKSRVSQEDDHRSRSRDTDYGKRRRITSD